MTDSKPRAVQLADDAYEAIRGINHLSISGGIPAPIVYDVLGNLKTAGGYGLQQTLSQLGEGLGLSLQKYDVYDGEGRVPAESVATARAALEQAANLAHQVGLLLDQAQSAINLQGYRTDDGD